MAALDMFEWFAERFYPEPTEEESSFLAKERRYLLSVRNENERIRHIESLLELEQARSNRLTA